MLLFPAADRAAYVSPIRPSSVGYGMFALKSFAYCCPTEYGGLPTTTSIGAASCRCPRSEFVTNTSRSSASPSSDIWNVSPSTIPGNSAYPGSGSPARRARSACNPLYVTSMFTAAT